MSFFGLDSSEQRNITENYIKSSVSSASSNITDNDFLNTQLAYAEVDFVNAGTLNCPQINITAVAENENKQNIKVISETHTDYDTTLTNNITNTMKNAVKQKTPGLMEAGLFSSQVNNQLNQAVNNTKNNISNKFFTKRKNMISTDQTGKSKVTLRNEGIIGCDGKGGKFDLRSEATNAVQTSFLLKTFDEESAKSGISNIITNTQSNVATQTGGGATAIIAALALLGCVYIYKNSGDDELDKGGSSIKDKIPRKIRVIILFIGLCILIGYCIYVLVQDDSYEIDTTKLSCDRRQWWDILWDFLVDNDNDNNYELKPEFDKDDSNYNEGVYNYCSNLKKNMDEWGDVRQESNFSATSTDINTSPESTFNGVQQYNRINDSKSLRGTIRELNDEGLAIDVDYTSLKLNPYSTVDCGDDGLKPGTDTTKEGCRTIKEDFIWEELIKKSCGCCRCDPNKIGYMNEWVENTGNNCYLDNTRKIGDYCDKNIDVIQPGSGYDTGTDYDTICRNEKYENKKCKKKDASGSIVDLEDDDPENITVSLISETECKSFNNSLVPDGDCDNVGISGDTVNGHLPGYCCYNELPGSQDWSSVTSALFGKNSGNKCTETGLSQTVSSLSTSLGICGPGCMKDDKCRVDYLNALREESDLAAGGSRDMNSRKDDCDPDTCLYKVKGVQEIKVTTVPPNHIEDPDNIYTIKHKVPNLGSQFQQHQQSGQGQSSHTDSGSRAALLAAAGVVFFPEVVVAVAATDATVSDSDDDTSGNQVGDGNEAGRMTPVLNPVEFTHDGGIRNNAEYLWQASSFIHFSNGLEEDYGLDNYHVHIGDAECDQLPDDIDYDTDGLKRPVNLCQCRFKRIPACIKNENGEYLENFGCPDDLGVDGSSCFECIDAKSGAIRRADYASKLKMYTIAKLTVSIVFYIIFSIWFMY